MSALYFRQTLKRPFFLPLNLQVSVSHNGDLESQHSSDLNWELSPLGSFSCLFFSRKLRYPFGRLHVDHYGSTFYPCLIDVEVKGLQRQLLPTPFVSHDVPPRKARVHSV